MVPIVSECEELKAEIQRLREGISKAASILDTYGRNPRAAYQGSVWLRTTYSLDHPNYLTPEQAKKYE